MTQRPINAAIPFPRADSIFTRYLHFGEAPTATPRVKRNEHSSQGKSGEKTGVDDAPVESNLTQELNRARTAGKKAGVAFTWGMS